MINSLHNARTTTRGRTLRVGSSFRRGQNAAPLSSSEIRGRAKNGVAPLLLTLGVLCAMTALAMAQVETPAEMKSMTIEGVVFSIPLHAAVLVDKTETEPKVYAIDATTKTTYDGSARIVRVDPVMELTE